MTTFRVYGHQVLIKKIPPPKSYGSGLLVIPDNWVKKSNQGLVVQVGKDVKYLKIGDYVVFEEMTATTLADANGEYHLVHENKIDCSITLEPEVIEGVYHVGPMVERNNGSGWDQRYFPATLTSIFDCLTEHYRQKGMMVSAVERRR